MKSSEQVRKELRRYIKKVIKENKEADAEWIVDKITTALKAAIDKKKDYQYVAAIDSDEFKKTAKDIKNKTEDEKGDQQLKETFLDWLASGARNIGSGVIDRRSGYLAQAMKHDPKLQKMAKDIGLSPKDFENKIYSMAKKDSDFLRALINQRAKYI
jgi:hypothetical protein